MTAPGFALTRRQLVLLASLTLVWGLNWPVMKSAISGFPPLTFRTASMWLGLPVLYAATRAMKIPLRVEREDWRELGLLTITNMIAWYALVIVSLQALSSGRAAILGYTMPIFSAIIGARMFGQRLSARTRIDAPTMAIVFWMTLVMTLLSIALERGPWTAPTPAAWFGIAYDAVLIIGFGQPIWLVLARSLPPVASTLSVMLIPVLGTASGAWWLGEQLHWQDVAAMLLMLVAIASVLWPARAPR